jgi:hypothetical protein
LIAAAPPSSMALFTRIPVTGLLVDRPGTFCWRFPSTGISSVPRWLINLTKLRPSRTAPLCRRMPHGLRGPRGPDCWFPRTPSRQPAHSRLSPFRDWQTFLYVQASEFARLPDRSYRCNVAAGPTLSLPGRTCFVTSARTGDAIRPNTAIEGKKDAHLSRLISGGRSLERTSLAPETDDTSRATDPFAGQTGAKARPSTGYSDDCVDRRCKVSGEQSCRDAAPYEKENSQGGGDPAIRAVFSVAGSRIFNNFRGSSAKAGFAALSAAPRVHRHLSYSHDASASC